LAYDEHILPWRESEDLPRIEHRREPPEGDMQRRGESGRPVKGQRTLRPKAHKALIAHASTDHSAEQFDRLKRERDEALEQLAAASEVLQVISSSRGKLEPVFQASTVPYTRTPPNPYPYRTRTVQPVLSRGYLQTEGTS
jgi:hypothetical protein